MAGNSILAAVDLQHEESDAHVAAEALSLARTHGADLHLIYVVPDQQISYVQNYVPKDMKAQVDADANEHLQSFLALLDTGDVSVDLHVQRGIVYEEIINVSNQISADFVVVGSNKPKLTDFFMGPNAARVARHAECSVMIVRPSRSD